MIKKSLQLENQHVCDQRLMQCRASVTEPFCSRWDVKTRTDDTKLIKKNQEEIQQNFTEQLLCVTAAELSDNKQTTGSFCSKCFYRSPNTHFTLCGRVFTAGCKSAQSWLEGGIQTCLLCSITQYNAPNNMKSDDHLCFHSF